MLQRPPTNTAILLTGEGAAALATVRLVGPGVSALLEAHVAPVPGQGQMVHARFRDGGHVLDDAVVYRDSEGAELHLHGGRWIVRRVLELAQEAGFEIAPPTAPLPPHLLAADSQLQAEILAWLPLAKTREAAAVLLAQEKAWQQLAEAVTDEELRAAAQQRGLYWLLHPPRIALVGLPNAGKSTLANALLGRERVIASARAGTTRDWVEEDANLDGLPARLVDTPGLRPAACEVEERALALARPVVDVADLVVLLLDATRPLSGEQGDLLQRFRGALVVAGKSDLPAAWDASEYLPVSGRTGAGLAELTKRIRERFECGRLLGALAPGAGGEGPSLRGVAALWTDRQRQVVAGTGSARHKVRDLIGRRPR
jgi:tRNA modification GTPase